MRKAAQENAAGIGGAIAISGPGKANLTDVLNELFRRAATVDDLNSYNNYLNYVNEIEANGLQKPILENGTSSNQYYWVYFVFYCCGSLLALWSIFYE